MVEVVEGGIVILLLCGYGVYVLEMFRCECEGLMEVVVG